MICLTDSKKTCIAVALSNYGDVMVHDRKRMDELLDIAEELEIHPILLCKGLRRAFEARERRNAGAGGLNAQTSAAAVELEVHQ